MLHANNTQHDVAENQDPKNQIVALCMCEEANKRQKEKVRSTTSCSDSIFLSIYGIDNHEIIKLDVAKAKHDEKIANRVSSAPQETDAGRITATGAGTDSESGTVQAATAGTAWSRT